MKPNPLLPVPNDDPACRCVLDPEVAPKGFTVITGKVTRTNWTRIAYDPACPHHSIIAEIMRRSVPLAFSVSVAPVPAEPA